MHPIDNIFSNLISFDQQNTPIDESPVIKKITPLGQTHIPFSHSPSDPDKKRKFEALESDTNSENIELGDTDITEDSLTNEDIEYLKEIFDDLSKYDQTSYKASIAACNNSKEQIPYKILAEPLNISTTHARKLVKEAINNGETTRLSVTENATQKQDKLYEDLINLYNNSENRLYKPLAKQLNISVSVFAKLLIKARDDGRITNISTKQMAAKKRTEQYESLIAVYNSSTIRPSCKTLANLIQTSTTQAERLLKEAEENGRITRPSKQQEIDELDQKVLKLRNSAPKTTLDKNLAAELGIKPQKFNAILKRLRDAGKLTTLSRPERSKEIEEKVVSAYKNAPERILNKDIATELNMKPKQFSKVLMKAKNHGLITDR